jgi:hypothetical protein
MRIVAGYRVPTTDGDRHPTTTLRVLANFREASRIFAFGEMTPERESLEDLAIESPALCIGVVTALSDERNLRR